MSREGKAGLRFVATVVLIKAGLTLLFPGCASVPLTATQVAQVRQALPKIAASAPAGWWRPGFGEAQPWTCDQARQRQAFTRGLHEPAMFAAYRQADVDHACGADMARAR